MSKNPIFATTSVILSALLALGAPAGMAAQSSPSPAMQTQTAPTGAQPGAAPAAAPAPLIIPAGPDYTKDIPWFPKAITPYVQRNVPEPVMVNSPKLQQLIHNGELQLSLNDAIQLAIENNLNIEVQRYVAWIADANVLKTLAGSLNSGLATGVTFDPTVTSTLSLAQEKIPVNNPLIAGTGTGATSISSLAAHNAQANVAFSKGFETGTQVSLAFNNTRASTSSPAAFFNPDVQSTLTFSFQQQLLNGFGLFPNTQFIVEARNNSKAARYTLENEVITVVTNVEDAYWNLVYARENVGVQQTSVNWAQKNLQDTQKQMQIGTLAQLDVVTAESQLASSQQALIVAQTNEQQQETVLLNLITRNPMAAGLENIQVVPTASINTPPQVDIIPYRDAVAEAWKDRPDLLAEQLALDNAGIAVRGARNALLPELLLSGSYATEGLAGNSLERLSTVTGVTADTNLPVVNANGTPVMINNQPVYTSSETTQTSVTRLSSGLLDAWNTAVNSNYPSYSLALTLNIPLRNRSAQANSTEALLTKRETELQVQSLKNSISESVRNAQIAIQQGLANVQAAVKATQLAQESLNAEQKKFEYGTSTDYNVILLERDLATAQGNEIQAKAGLLEAIVTFNQALGRTLQVNNISVADATSGHVVHAPQIPGTPVNTYATNPFQPSEK
jgi:outer membrane protein